MFNINTAIYIKPTFIFRYCVIMAKNILLISIICSVLISTYAKKTDDSKKPDWAKKDIRDFTDADMES